MRVLHVIPSVAPRYGGPSRAVFEMCRALRAEGCETLVVTTDADGDDRLDVPCGEQVDYEGVPTLFFPRQASEAFKYSRPLARWLRKNVNAFDAVHIHAVFSHACVAAARACRASGVPYVVRPLGTLDPWSMRQKPLRKRLMWLAAAGRMMRGAAAIHYTAREEQKLAEESLVLSAGIVIPLGVEVFNSRNGKGESSAPESPSVRPRYVLSLSRIHPKKNLEMLIQVFSRLSSEERFGGWRLVIAGDGDSDYVGSLKALARTSGIEERVSFPGWLEGEAKRTTLENAGVLVLASHQENFGICAVEALASGVPVLVSEGVNIAPDIREAVAGWVTTLDADGLKGALSAALADEAERRRRGAAGRQFALSRFAWPAIARQTIDLYQALGASRRA